MKNIFIPIAAFTLFFSCTSNNQDKKVAHVITAENDTLSYHYDSVRVVSNNLSAGLTDSTTAVVSYPIFDDQQLNKHILQQTFNFYRQNEPVSTYQDIASGFVGLYNEFYLENKGSSHPWHLSLEIKVIRQLHNYIALQYTHSDYAGGAHGNTHVSFDNYNPKTQKVISLDSLIQPGKKEELLKVAESIFRAQEKISASQSLKERYFFQGGNFSLPAAFYVSKEGLKFFYNSYDIKPYAEGTTELIIPFDQLKNIAKPNTILTPNADI